MAWIKSFLHWGKVLFCAPKENQKSARYFRGAGGTRKGLLAPFRPRRGCRSPKMLAASLNAFLGFSGLRLRRWCYAFAELYVLQGHKVCCEAANRRNEKKALSAATSFFPFRQLLRDYQGRAALDSCLPRLESSGHFSGSLLVRKRELDLA